MATLTIPDLPDDLVARLEAAAQRHQLSLSEDLRAALEQRYLDRGQLLARVQVGRTIYRFLGFFRKSYTLSCHMWFQEEELEVTTRATGRGCGAQAGTPGTKEQSMSDLRRYISQRKARDPEFAEDFDSGYADFKIGVALRQAREDAA